jgi:hypothetical protein
VDPRIQILGSMPLTSGSGCGSRSCYFRHLTFKTRYFVPAVCITLRIYDTNAQHCHKYWLFLFFLYFCH